jgi:hypothetical protein
MVEVPATIDDQIKQVELQLKQRDLEDRRSWWNGLKTPPVTAAVLTAWVAIASLLFGWVTSCSQENLERQKLQSSILLGILQQYQPNMVPGRNEAMLKERVKVAIQSGMISDDDGRICMAFITEGCPIKILKAK